MSFVQEMPSGEYPRRVKYPLLTDRRWVAARVAEGLTDWEIADIVGNGCYATMVQYWRGKVHGIKKPRRYQRQPMAYWPGHE